MASRTAASSAMYALSTLRKASAISGPLRYSFQASSSSYDRERCSFANLTISWSSATLASEKSRSSSGGSFFSKKSMSFCTRFATVPQVTGPCSPNWGAQNASKYSRVSLLMPALSLTAAASVGSGVGVDAGVDVAVGGLPVVAPGVLVLDEPPQAVRARVSIATPSSRTRMGHLWPRACCGGRCLFVCSESEVMRCPPYAGVRWYYTRIRRSYQYICRL